MNSPGAKWASRVALLFPRLQHELPRSDECGYDARRILGREIFTKKLVDTKTRVVYLESSANEPRRLDELKPTPSLARRFYARRREFDEKRIQQTKS